VDPAAALYADADRARRSGHAAEAAELLEKAVSAESSGHRAALAAFTLGRLYLEELGKPAAATRAFERSLHAGPPRGLEEDVRARLVEARTKVGDSEGARRAASEYRARFPGGRRTADVERWSPGE
jgi:transmembrane sensor